MVNPGWADRDRGLFSISVAAELAGLHPQTLRIYEREGLIDPARSAGGNKQRRVRSPVLARYARHGRLRWALTIALGIVLALSRLPMGYACIAIGVFGLAAYEIQRYRASRGR